MPQVRSGGYAHNCEASVALGCVPTHQADARAMGRAVIAIIARRRPARLQWTPIYDLEGRRMRE
ncbi:MAG: hypothetical protein LC798_03310 [Chloroflexi bacterium]|nr:hypothetical protein [Chloroflexota bacterium]